MNRAIKSRAVNCNFIWILSPFSYTLVYYTIVIRFLFFLHISYHFFHPFIIFIISLFLHFNLLLILCSQNYCCFFIHEFILLISVYKFIVYIFFLSLVVVASTNLQCDGARVIKILPIVELMCCEKWSAIHFNNDHQPRASRLPPNSHLNVRARLRKSLRPVQNPRASPCDRPMLFIGVQFNKISPGKYFLHCPVPDLDLWSKIKNIFRCFNSKHQNRDTTDYFHRNSTSNGWGISKCQT